LQIAAGSLIGGGANAVTSASIHIHDQFVMIRGVADYENECLLRWGSNLTVRTVP